MESTGRGSCAFGVEQPVWAVAHSIQKNARSIRARRTSSLAACRDVSFGLVRGKSVVDLPFRPCIGRILYHLLFQARPIGSARTRSIESKQLLFSTRICSQHLIGTTKGFHLNVGPSSLSLLKFCIPYCVPYPCASTAILFVVPCGSVSCRPSFGMHSVTKRREIFLGRYRIGGTAANPRAVKYGEEGFECVRIGRLGGYDVTWRARSVTIPDRSGLDLTFLAMDRKSRRELRGIRRYYIVASGSKSGRMRRELTWIWYSFDIWSSASLHRSMSTKQSPESRSSRPVLRCQSDVSPKKFEAKISRYAISDRD